MAKSINRRLAESLTGVDAGLDSAEVLALTGGGTTYYNTLEDLPITGLTAGNTAFVEENRRLYVSDGNGWYNAALVNRGPRWDSGGEPDASYTIVDSATPLIITARAIDSDNVNFINQATASDSAQYLVDISNDSSVFTFTPKSADSIGQEVAAGNLTDSGGDFLYTFKWSDGINFVSKTVTIAYNTVAGGIATAWGGIRGFMIMGQTNGTATFNEIEYFDISAGSGNSSDFGDLTVATAYGSSGGNKIRGVTRHGDIDGFSGNWETSFSNVLDYFVCATPGNATDFGDANLKYKRSSAVSNGTRAIFGLGNGGVTGGSFSQTNTALDYVTINTTSNTSTFGNLTIGRNGGSATNDDTRGVFIGGYNGSAGSNVMDYITMDTTGNATDFGDVAVGFREYSSQGNISNNVIGLYVGGYYENVNYTYSNIIEKITIQTTGNATDFGDTIRGRNESGTCSDGVTGAIVGGYNGFSNYLDADDIEKVIIDTPGNATSFGSISIPKWGLCGMSGNAA